MVGASSLALLPLACLVLLALGRRRPEPDRDWREGFLAGLVAWGVLVSLIAESTSALRRFDRPTVAGLWALAAAILVAARLRRRSAPHAEIRASLSPSDRTLVGGALLIWLLVGVAAVAAPPNTWDALSYHMPRVAHWIQNRSVAHYPTHILRQLYLPPLPEFVVSQLQLLSRGDHFANLVQWAALAGSLVAVSRIAGQLNAEASGQTLSVALAVSLPMAILQGSSSQTDLVTGLWLLVFVSGVLASRHRDWSPGLLFALGGSLGLALATKPTAGIFAAPFLVWLAAIGVQRFGFRIWKSFVALAALVVALNLPHAWRNAALFGSPLGISRGAVNEPIGLTALVSNFARNAALHAATPFPVANRFVEGVVADFQRAIGLDVDDPRTTWRGSEFRVPPGPLGGRFESDESVYALFHEDTAGNPIQSLLAVFSVVVLFARPALRARRDLTMFAASLLFAFLLFCAVLKWQPWHSRLHLPLFLLAAPLTAVVLSATGLCRIGEWLGVLLLASALPWVFANATRPLVGPQSVLSTARVDQYFSGRSALARTYSSAARALADNRCLQVGLVTGPDEAEYLLWVLLERELPGRVRIEHVEVGNVSRARERELPPFSPCAVVRVVPGPEGEELRVEMIGDR